MQRLMIAAAAAFCLTACGKPVPVEKVAYVGQWSSANMSVLITQDGHINYQRQDGGQAKSISAPIKGFNGDNFDAGVGPMSTTFVVTAPPHQDGASMKMTVDGVELTKTQSKDQ